MLRQAQELAEQRKTGADAYAAETLRNLREHLLSIETEMSRHILSIEKGLESLGISLGADEQESFVLEDESYEEAEEFEEAPLQPIPRRASLATDTTGSPTYQ
jgi:hypothetical protein